jgi:hypothetical protein
VGKETAAILLITAVHVVGAGVLLWLMLGEERLDWNGWWRPDEPLDPRPSGDGLPLPDADPAAVRLRTAHERLGNGRRRVRGPAHAPGRQPERVER